MKKDQVVAATHQGVLGRTESLAECLRRVQFDKQEGWELTREYNIGHARNLLGCSGAWLLDCVQE